MYIIYNNVFSNIWDSIFVVIVNLDSLRSLHLASISARILISSTFFFSTLRFQIENRNTAVIHTSGKWCSSSMSKSRVSRLVNDRVGRNFLSPWRSTWQQTWLSGQEKKTCSRVSGVLFWLLEQIGDWLGRILPTLAAVGRIWWRSLKRKLTMSGPSICCLARSHVLSHGIDGDADSILSGFRTGAGPSLDIVTSSTRNL